jgi:hypothetical protein
MTVPTNTVQTPSRVGNREDLSDIIYDISPTETPFVTAVGKGSAEAVYHEWQTDALATADATNKNIQGDDVANDSRAATTRVGTYTQLMDKVVGTSSTQNAVRAAGRSKGEHAYQLAKSMKEIKRDMEARVTGNYASVAPTASVAGETAGALAWLTSNTSKAGSDGGFSGGIVAAATNGTQRAFTEALFKTVLQSVWTAGGDASICLVNAAQKVAASAFTGIATQRRETGNKRATIIGAADVYVSDFGEVTFTADRFCSTRDALLVDPSMWSIDTLQPMQRSPLAKTGHAERDMIFCEWALKCNNQAASGAVRDLT